MHSDLKNVKKERYQQWSWATATLQLQVTWIRFFRSCDPYLIFFWQCEQHKLHWIWHFWIRIRQLLNVVLNRIRIWFFFNATAVWTARLHLLWLWHHSDPRCTAPVNRPSTLGETPPLPEASQHLLELVSLGYFNIVSHEDLVHSFSEVMHNSANRGLCDAKQAGQGAVTHPLLLHNIGQVFHYLYYSLSCF